MAAPFLAELRRAVGLRPMLGAVRPAPTAVSGAPTRTSLPVFKQYREADGRFHFKLAAADGRLLLQSEGLADAREAGAWVKRLKTEGAAALAAAPVQRAPGVAEAEVRAALCVLAASD